MKYRTASPDRYALLKQLAKEQRDYPTEAERLLWFHLRNNQLGVKFNRQHIIGDYIVDFVCIEKGLIVEVDGGYHDGQEQHKNDIERTISLTRMGFHVIRFDNNTIFQNIESVIDTIYDELADL